MEALKGNRKGLFSIRVNKQWRICFKWENGRADNFAMEPHFWMNLQARYDIEVAKDEIEDWINQEIEPYAA